MASVTVLSTGMLRTAAVSVLVVATACGGGKGSSGGSTGPSNKADKPAPGATQTADDVLGFLPANSDVVVGIDGVALRSSAMWKQFEPQIEGAFGAKLPAMREKCGFDPLTSIERVTLGGTMTTDNEQLDGVIVVRGVSGQQTLDCIAAATEGEGSVKMEAGKLVLDRGGSDKMVATIVGANTLVVQMGKTASVASISAVLDGGAPLRSSPAFMAMFDRREANSSVWGMINGNSPLLAEAAQAGAKPKSVDGTLVVNDRFIGAIRIGFENDADANKVHGQLSQVLPIARSYFEKLDLRADGSVLRGDVIATDAQMMKVFEQLFR